MKSIMLADMAGHNIEYSGQKCLEELSNVCGIGRYVPNNV